jgi:hypothetical protein
MLDKLGDLPGCASGNRPRSWDLPAALSWPVVIETVRRFSLAGNF